MLRVLCERPTFELYLRRQDAKRCMGESQMDFRCQHNGQEPAAMQELSNVHVKEYIYGSKDKTGSVGFNGNFTQRIHKRDRESRT